MSSKIEEMAVEYIQTVYPTDSRICGMVRDYELERHCVAFARVVLEEARRLKQAVPMRLQGGGMAADFCCEMVSLTSLEALFSEQGGA